MLLGEYRTVNGMEATLRKIGEEDLANLVSKYYEEVKKAKQMPFSLRPKEEQKMWIKLYGAYSKAEDIIHDRFNEEII